jgi:hypothetical protein
MNGRRLVKACAGLALAAGIIALVGLSHRPAAARRSSNCPTAGCQVVNTVAQDGLYFENNVSGQYAALIGVNDYASGYGVWGGAPDIGFVGQATSTSDTRTAGVYGYTNSTGTGSAGVFGTTQTSGNTGVTYGVYGENPSTTADAAGVYGYETAASGATVGVYGVADSTAGAGVYGLGADGVFGQTSSSSGIGVVGEATTSTANYAGYFSGNVYVTGTLTATTKNFKIDDPIDPANKYLSHSCVESDRMMNVYDGSVILNTDGKAVVQMAPWFNALNEDFHYQLTPVGKPALVYISNEMSDGSFEISGGSQGVRIDWQVTGVRHDRFAVNHPLIVEQDKTGVEKGRYMDPADFGKPEAMGMRPVLPVRYIATHGARPLVHVPRLRTSRSDGQSGSGGCATCGR